MARKNDSPQKAAIREMMSVILEGALDEEYAVVFMAPHLLFII